MLNPPPPDAGAGADAAEPAPNTALRMRSAMDSAADALLPISARIASAMLTSSLFMLCSLLFSASMGLMAPLASFSDAALTVPSSFVMPTAKPSPKYSPERIVTFAGDAASIVRFSAAAALRPMSRAACSATLIFNVMPAARPAPKFKPACLPMASISSANSL